MAHELSHVRNFDIRFSLMVGVLVGSIALLADFFLRFTFWGGGRRSRRDSDSGGGGAADRRVRGRDRARDPRPDRRPARPAGGQPAARVPRRRVGRRADPEPGRPRAGAGEDRRSTPEPLEVANRATQHLYFENPIKARDAASQSNLFSTHPPVAGPDQPAARAAAASRPSTIPDQSSAWRPPTRRLAGPSGPPALPPGSTRRPGSVPSDAPRRPAACSPCRSFERHGILRRADGPSRGTRDRAEIAQLVEHATENRGVASSNLALGTIHPVGLSSGSGSVGRASPCQGEGRGFESRLPLHSSPAPRSTSRHRCPFV